MAPHGPQQGVEVQWFRESRNGAESDRARLGVRLARHDRDRNARDAGVPELRTPEFTAAQTRHRKIQKDQTGNVGRAVLQRAKQVQRLEAVFRGDDVEAFGREEARHHLARVEIVVDDEDIAGRGHVAERDLQVPYRHRGHSVQLNGRARVASFRCVPSRVDRTFRAACGGRNPAAITKFTLAELSARC